VIASHAPCPSAAACILFIFSSSSPASFSSAISPSPCPRGIAASSQKDYWTLSRRRPQCSAETAPESAASHFSETMQQYTHLCSRTAREEDAINAAVPEWTTQISATASEFMKACTAEWLNAPLNVGLGFRVLGLGF